MDLAYALVPFVAWFIAGSIKFVINSIKARQAAFVQIGYGGLPSNHTAIVSSAAALIAIRQGLDSAPFCAAVALAFIVMLDAGTLRRQIGAQAQAINRLTDSKDEVLRESMGHSRLEIAAGIFVGISTAWIVDQLFRSVG